MKIYRITLFLILIAFVSNSIAQEFATPLSAFSHDKIAYITLIDGTEIKGNIKDIDRKKGLIEEITIKSMKGKKQKLDPEEIKYMYLPPSNLSKLVKLDEVVFDVKKWGKTNLNNDILSKGYVYFEKAEVKIKKKTRTLMMQLLNPQFSQKIRVYEDPFAKETMSLGVGPLDVVGGNLKSYYVKIGDEVAYKLEKKRYKDEFKLIFKDCEEVIKEFEAELKWTDFAKHVVKYTEVCK